MVYGSGVRMLDPPPPNTSDAAPTVFVNTRSYSASANASSKINTIGGNTLLGGNAAQWIPSIEPCETWRIISFQDWVPVATFLPAETKKAVERIMNSSAWTAATAQDAAAAKQAATQGPK